MSYLGRMRRRFRKAGSANQENVRRWLALFYLRIGAARHDVMEKFKYATVVGRFQVIIFAAATRSQRDRYSFRVQVTQ